MDRRTHRAFANSAARSLLRACASPHPPSRSELAAEMAAQGFPEQHRDALLSAAEMVATTATTGKVGRRRADAQNLADRLALELHNSMVKADSLAPADQQDDGGDQDDDAARITAHTRSGVAGPVTAPPAR